MSKRAAKVAIGVSATAGAGLALFFLTRKAKAAEGEAEAARGEAEAARGEAASARADAASAAARAARAQQFALDAQRRLAHAQQLVAWTRAHAQQSGQAARAAIDAANRAIAQATQAADEARNLFAQAQAERSSERRAALEREAQTRADHAEELRKLADEAKANAERADAEARKRADAEKVATSTATRTQKETQQAVVTAQEETKEAVKKAGPDVVNIECSRQAVASGFQELKGELQKNNPRMTEQQAVNAAANIMRRDGIVLDKPNPALPFWQQSCDVVRGKVRKTINVYLAAHQKAISPQVPTPAETEPDEPPAPTPTVTTPAQQKQAIANQMWSKAIEYAQAVGTFSRRPLTRLQAARLIGPVFRENSCPAGPARLHPGCPTVPTPANLTAPSPYWALSLDQVRAGLTKALQFAVSKANTDQRHGVLTLALNPRDNTRTGWVMASEVQVTPDNRVIRKNQIIQGRPGPLYPVAKVDAKFLDPSDTLPVGAFAGHYMSDSFTEMYREQDNLGFAVV